MERYISGENSDIMKKGPADFDNNVDGFISTSKFRKEVEKLGIDKPSINILRGIIRDAGLNIIEFNGIVTFDGEKRIDKCKLFYIEVEKIKDIIKEAVAKKIVTVNNKVNNNSYIEYVNSAHNDDVVKMGEGRYFDISSGNFVYE